MLYLAFDLDGTLGNFLILWKFLCGLRQSEFYRTPLASPPSEDLKWELDISYSSFVKHIADAETSDNPLGIFRPRIFDMLKTVAKLKAQGKITGVIMYTNNSSLSLVNLVRDVVHYVVKAPLFDGIFHYTHPIRPVLKLTGKPSPNKSWAELSLILKAAGAPETIEPQNVMFFDDQIHQDLLTRLGANYIKAFEYTYNPPLSTVADLYYSSLKNSNLTQGSKNAFVKHLGPCHNPAANSINSHLSSMRALKSTHYYAAGMGPLPADNALSSMHMLNAINAKFPSSKNGGSRKIKKRKQQKSRKQLWTRY